MSECGMTTRPPGLIDALLARLRGPQAEPGSYPVTTPTAKTRGFAEAAPYLSRGLSEMSDSEAGPSTTLSTPFASTGPQGHRARMRNRVLMHGATTLADYELLEMLLFFAFKKGDTKPLSKTLINRFGSFANVLAAPPRRCWTRRALGRIPSPR
jgi:hypothetical protein